MRHARHAFSLIELVMVVVIIAVIGAIAIPRLTRGSASAAESALRADLVAMNKAIELYAAEHDGNFPSTSAIAAQLTMYTSASGATSATSSSTHLFGPYLRAIPPQPLGSRKGNTVIATADAPTVGWLYNATTGTIEPAGSVVITASGAVQVGGAEIQAEEADD